MKKKTGAVVQNSKEKPEEEEVKLKSGLETLVDATLAIEKLRVAVQVRQSHLKLKKRRDPETDALLVQLQTIEEYVDGRVAILIKDHPAYPWFSRVKGIGKENIGKVVAQVDITKANSISGLWQFCGFGVEGNNSDGFGGHAPKRIKGGGKLCYNSNLRSMCYRLSTSILKAQLRQQCVKCGGIMGQGAVDKNDGKCPKCKHTEFRDAAIGKFGEYYLKEKAKYIARFTNQGYSIVTAAALPTKDGKRYEPERMISEGHIHNMANRKMIKMLLAMLWLKWREAEGLPIREPYSAGQLGHVHIYTPDEFIDRD